MHPALGTKHKAEKTTAFTGISGNLNTLNSSGSALTVSHSVCNGKGNYSAESGGRCVLSLSVLYPH